MKREESVSNSNVQCREQVCQQEVTDVVDQHFYLDTLLVDRILLQGRMTGAIDQDVDLGSSGYQNVLSYTPDRAKVG